MFISDIYLRYRCTCSFMYFEKCFELTISFNISYGHNIIYIRGRRGRDRMVVGFTTTCAISAYHH